MEGKNTNKWLIGILGALLGLGIISILTSGIPANNTKKVTAQNQVSRNGENSVKELPLH